MSPVMPSSGESLQEMIDRYNRELLRMGSLERPREHSTAHSAPPPSRPPVPRPRPEPSEPLYNADSGMPRPLPIEPLDEHHSPVRPPHSAGNAADPETQQGLADFRQGLCDLMQGLADLQAGLRELQKGLGDHIKCPGYGRPPHHSPFLPASAELSDAVTAAADERVPVTPTIPGRVPAQTPSPAPEDNYGTLIVQVFTARRAEPVSGAQVAVTMPTDEGELLYKVMTTNEDGRTPALRLPIAGYSTGAPEYRSPFANYRVYASADGYQPSGALTAQMFPGVTSILPVELIPGEKVND